MIVKKQAKPQQPALAHAASIRKHKSRWRNDMRRQTPHHVALLERVPDKAELVVFEVAQAAVNELGRTGGCAAGQIALLKQHNRRPAASRIAGDSAAVHPAPD